MPNGYKLYGYGERPPFVSFQRDLLRQHDITCDQTLVGNKTPACCYLSARVHLTDIHRGTVTNALALAALTADNIKVPIRFILRQLFRRFSKLMPRLSDWVQPASRYQFTRARARRAPTVMIPRRRSTFSRFPNIYAPGLPPPCKPANVAIWRIVPSVSERSRFLANMKLCNGKQAIRLRTWCEPRLRNIRPSPDAGALRFDIRTAQPILLLG